MSILSKLKRWFTKSRDTILHEEYPIPEGYVSLYKEYDVRCADFYISREGTVYNKVTNTYYRKYRYFKIRGVYYYLPKLMLHVFDKKEIKNIHAIRFLDSDRTNWNISNLEITDPNHTGYFAINSYTHELGYNTPGRLRNTEYVVYMKDLLDHNWTYLYRKWLHRTYPYSNGPSCCLGEIHVDIQNNKLSFHIPQRGVPLGQPIKGMIVYSVVMDNKKEDFWIIPPRRGLDLRDLVRYNTGYTLAA